MINGGTALSEPVLLSNEVQCWNEGEQSPRAVAHFPTCGLSVICPPLPPDRKRPDNRQPSFSNSTAGEIISFFFLSSYISFPVNILQERVPAQRGIVILSAMSPRSCLFAELLRYNLKYVYFSFRTEMKIISGLLWRYSMHWLPW